MAAPLLSAIDKSKCRYCDSEVSKGFRRTFGDNDDVAHRCFDCDTDRRVKRGSAAGRNIDDSPDPAEPNNSISHSDTPALTDGGIR